MRDVILGGQDGLVNTLGIVLGISAASSDNKVLIAASLAAGFAEAISMGAVAFTSSRAEQDHSKKEIEREKEEIESKPQEEAEEVREIYSQKGFSGNLLEEIVKHITNDKERWLKTLVKEELNFEKIETKAIIRTSIIVALAALLASSIPIIPFIILPKSQATATALLASATTLFAIGAYEAKTYVGHWLKNGAQMVVIGLGAALTGFVIGKLFGAN